MSNYVNYLPELTLNTFWGVFYSTSFFPEQFIVGEDCVRIAIAQSLRKDTKQNSYLNLREVMDRGDFFFCTSKLLSSIKDSFFVSTWKTNPHWNTTTFGNFVFLRKYCHRGRDGGGGALSFLPVGGESLDKSNIASSEYCKTQTMRGPASYWESRPLDYLTKVVSPRHVLKHPTWIIKVGL